MFSDLEQRWRETSFESCMVKGKWGAAADLAGTEKAMQVREFTAGSHHYGFSRGVCACVCARAHSIMLNPLVLYA